MAILFGIALSLASASAMGRDRGAVPPRAFLDTYCVTCHNHRLKTAGVELDTTDVSDVAAAVSTWEGVVRKVRSGTMPPAGAPRPDRALAADFVTRVEALLDRAAA